MNMVEMYRILPLELPTIIFSSNTLNIPKGVKRLFLCKTEKPLYVKVFMHFNEKLEVISTVS